VPEKFPLPIEASDVLVRVQNREGELISGTFRGIGGGEAQVAARFTVPFADDEDQQVRPEITIEADGMPLNRLLIHALPSGRERGGEEAGFKRILHALRVKGEGIGRVLIHPRESGELGFDAEFALTGSELQPGDEVTVADVSGRVVANESRVDVEVAGQARARLADGSWAIASGPLAAAITTIIPPAKSQLPVRYTADVRMAGVELAAKFEEIVSVFSPAAAAQIADLRRDHRPQGQVDLVTRVSAAGKEPPEVTIEARGRLPVTFDGGGGRVSFTPADGLVRIDSRGSTHLGFDALRGRAEFDGSPVGDVVLAGSMMLKRSEGEDPDDEHVQLKVREGVVESALVGKLMGERIGGEIGELWLKHLPRGRYEADLTIAAGADGAMEVRGGVTPRQLVLKAGDDDVVFSNVSGSIDFGPGAGAIRALALFTPRWSATVSGWWTAPAKQEVHTQAEFAVRGEELAPELTALLPETVSRVLHDIKLRVEGPFQLKGAELELVRGSRRSTQFRGLLEMEDASIDAGATIEKLVGTADIRFHGEQGLPPQFEVRANAERFETGGIVMGAGSALVTNGRRAGEVLVPMAFAHAHGGRVAAEAKVLPGENGPDSAAKNQRAYTAAVGVSGLRLATLLQDLEASFDSPVVPDDDRSRGLVEGSFTVQGLIGQPETRRGRGNFQIAGGRILNVPFMMRMVELSNLQLPTNAKLGYANGTFFLDGGHITFENLGLYSSAVQILGSGTMTWPGKVLDLRFDTKPARGIPILSGLLRGIRDELITTSVQGTLAKPDVKLKQFPGPRRMLGRDPGSGRDEPPVDGQWRGEPEERRVEEGIRPTRPPERR
jgi:hypothetical protein